MEEYYFDGGDFIAQILYELYNHPDSCFSKDVGAWYNSLYSELSYDGSCKYRLPDPEPPPTEAIEQFLLDYGVDLAFDVLEGYLIAQFGGVNPNEFNNAINNLKQLVQSQI